MPANTDAVLDCKLGEENIMTRLSRMLIVAFAFSASQGFAAESYPDRPVRFIVPFPAGGGTDALARILGGKLTEFWGQQVLIDNRAGAQGNIGTAAGARAAPDGYTITLAQSGALAINPHLYSNSGFDTLRDFAAVSRGIEMPYTLVVHPSVPVKTIKELVLLAKRNPGKLTHASVTSSSQLVGELFKLTTGTNMLHVPYKGAAPALIDLLAGNVSMLFAAPTPTLPYVKIGKLRALGVMSNKRLETLPDVPTAVEAGYPELGNVLEWYGVVVPASTPRDTIAKLNSAIVRALNSTDVLERLRPLGQTSSPSTPAEFAEYIRVDFERWGKVVKASGAKVD
jgi:tripartite-type tricarboxylate transporter receptor subunit TctC